MESTIAKLKKQGIVSFSIHINQKEQNGVWKKDPTFPKGWNKFTMDEDHYEPNYNGLAMLTGQSTGIFVIDIDNIDHWKQLLEEEEEKEPIAVKVLSGSGGMHLYFKYTDDLKDLKSISKAIKDYDIDIRTNGGCIFAPPTTYHNKNLKHTVKYTWEHSIYDYGLSEVPKWLKNLLFAKQMVKKDAPTIKNVKPTDLLQQPNLKLESIKVNKDMISDILNGLNKKRADDWEAWRNILFALKCENTDEYYELFDTFSKKSKHYCQIGNLTRWDACNPIEASKKKKIYTYSSLIGWLKEDNIKAYRSLCEKYKLFPEDDDMKINKETTLEIKQDYLLTDNKITDCKVSQCVKSFITDDVKNLMIKSPYNTGKTSFLTQICDNFKSILFISYRITLSNNIYGEFKKLGFELYTDNINSERLICQVDSLRKINGLTFDLVIMDESESILNHFSSGSLLHPLDTFQFMISLCYNAKKIIALDGDLNNRTKYFIESLGLSHLIVNTIKKDPKKFIFSENEQSFQDNITNNLKNGKNLVIVSMSEKQATHYYDKFSKDYGTILYTSKTNDYDKKMLCEVKAIWSKYQLVIYSPSIESGVDYNVEHFDNIYIIMSTGSTSQRGLNQMMNRVRQIKDKNIYCYLNKILPNEFSERRHYTFEEVKAFYNILMDEVSEFSLDDDLKIVYNHDNHTEIGIYDMVMMYNKMETLNKNVNCFLPLFIKMIKDKGHDYMFLNDKQPPQEPHENLVIGKIVNASKITKVECEELKEKQIKHKMTEDEKFMLLKHMYEGTFNADFDDIAIVTKYYNRLYIVKNAQMLLDDKTIVFNNSKMKNTEKFQKIFAVRSLLEVFKTTPESIKNNTHRVLNDMLTSSVFEINEILTNNKIIFELAKNFNISTTKQMVGKLRTLLKDYGISMDIIHNQKKVDGKKVTLPSDYKFAFEDEVKNKLDNKLLDFDGIHELLENEK